MPRWLESTMLLDELFIFERYWQPKATEVQEATTLWIPVIPDHAKALVGKGKIRYCVSSHRYCAIEQKSCILTVHQTDGDPMTSRRVTA
jgi:hypothetical protein